MAQHLTIEERIKLEALLDAGISLNEISKQLGRHRSTIYRERHKPGVLTDKYNASTYQKRARQNMSRDQSSKGPSTETIKIIEEKILNYQWSPEQISNWLRKHKQETACHTWIYKHIRIDKDQGGELHNNLRRGNYLKGHKPYKGKIKNRISIEQRPEEINQRTRCGDYEIDLIVGPKNQGAILSIVDRLSRECRLEKLEDKSAKSVTSAVIERLPANVLSVTSDNGTEFSNHEKISTTRALEYYFAHPYASYERGSIENLNGLVRQYIPKGKRFESVDSKEVKIIESKLNNRPRKVLEFMTPLEYVKKHACALRL